MMFLSHGQPPVSRNSLLPFSTSESFPATRANEQYATYKFLKRTSLSLPTRSGHHGIPTIILNARSPMSCYLSDKAQSRPRRGRLSAKENIPLRITFGTLDVPHDRYSRIFLRNLFLSYSLFFLFLLVLFLFFLLLFLLLTFISNTFVSG